MRPRSNSAARHFFCLIVPAVFLLGSSPFSAFSAELSGEGISITRGGSGGDWEANDETGDWSFQTDNAYSGIGLLLDISATPALLKHQRLRLGYEKFKSTVEGCVNDCRLKADRFAIDHVLKFEIGGQDDTVFWIGPELRLSRTSGSPDGSPEMNITLWGFGIGAELGADIDLDRDVRLAFELGYVWNWYDGKGSAPGYSVSYDVEETYPFFVVSFIFGL